MRQQVVEKSEELDTMEAKLDDLLVILKDHSKLSCQIAEFKDAAHEVRRAPFGWYYGCVREREKCQTRSWHKHPRTAHFVFTRTVGFCRLCHPVACRAMSALRQRLPFVLGLACQSVSASFCIMKLLIYFFRRTAQLCKPSIPWLMPDYVALVCNTKPPCLPQVITNRRGECVWWDSSQDLVCPRVHGV